MNCPKCPTQLLIADKHGVEIDYCPNCRGIWLDRGELDKIIEREMTMTSQNNNFGYNNNHDDEHEYKRENNNDNKYNKYNQNQKNGKRGFLSDLFDF